MRIGSRVTPSVVRAVTGQAYAISKRRRDIGGLDLNAIVAVVNGLDHIEQDFLVEYEGANQTYAWYHFAAAAVKQGDLPLWDPYDHAGRPFAGEMQTAPFYPLKLFLYLWPFNRGGLLSPTLLHEFFVFAHLLGAVFMFLLGRTLGLDPFSAAIAGICFSIGGFVGRINWPDMLDTAIWLPLVFLWLLRALESNQRIEGVLAACVAGVCLGMSILAGRIHIVMMAVLAVTGAVAYAA